MRIFTRMDVTVLRHEEKFHFVVNELTRSNEAGLFLHWDRGEMDLCIQDLAKVLHFISFTDAVDNQRL